MLISGPARIAAPLGAVLAASGVGHVDTAIAGRADAADTAVGGVRHDDTGRPLRTAVADAVLRAAPHAVTTSLREGNGHVRDADRAVGPGRSSSLTGTPAASCRTC